jgi:hypothetical protein
MSLFSGRSYFSKTALNGYKSPVQKLKKKRGLSYIVHAFLFSMAIPYTGVPVLL